MIKLAMQRYETLESDPLIDNNLKVYVADSSPCIGQYKLTCLQNDSVFLSPAGFERCTVQTLVVFAGRFCLEIAWCVTRLCCAPAWAVQGYFFVGCVVLLPCGLYCVSPSWLRCIAPLWAVLHCSFVAVLCSSFMAVSCSSFVGCVDSLQAVLYRHFVGTVEGCSILPVRKGFQHPRSSLLTAGIFAGKRLRKYNVHFILSFVCLCNCQGY